MPENDSIQTGLAYREAEVPGMRGDAAVCRLEPPYVSASWDDGESITHTHVVVSAVDLDFGGFSIPDYRTSETMIFPSDGTKVADFAELAMVGHKSHADALEQIGYEVSA